MLLFIGKLLIFPQISRLLFFILSVYSSKTQLRQFQVLVDLAGLARLEWQQWDMFSRPLIGTVAYNDRSARLEAG